MNEEKHFLGAISAGEPNADLVYADWLEEQGRPEADEIRDPTVVVLRQWSHSQCRLTFWSRVMSWSRCNSRSWCNSCSRPWSRYRSLSCGQFLQWSCSMSWSRSRFCSRSGSL